MKCPKCGYTSFDYNAACPKCSKDLTASRELLNIPAFVPQAKSYLESLMSSGEEDFSFEEHEETEHLGAYEDDIRHDDEAGGEDSPEAEPVELKEESSEISFDEPGGIEFHPDEESSGILLEPEDDDLGISLEDEIIPESEEESGIAFAQEEDAPQLDDRTMILEPDEAEDDEALDLGALMDEEPELLLGEEDATPPPGALGVEETMILDSPDISLEEEPEMEADELDLGELEITGKGERREAAAIDPNATMIIDGSEDGLGSGDASDSVFLDDLDETDLDSEGGLDLSDLDLDAPEMKADPEERDAARKEYKAESPNGAGDGSFSPEDEIDLDFGDLALDDDEKSS